MPRLATPSFKLNLEKMFNYHMSSIEVTVRWPSVLVFVSFLATTSTSLVIYFNAWIFCSRSIYCDDVGGGGGGAKPDGTWNSRYNRSISRLRPDSESLASPGWVFASEIRPRSWLTCQRAIILFVLEASSPTHLRCFFFSPLLL